MGFCQPSSYLCRRCLAAASAVLASVALFSIMPINCGPILISSVSLPVAVLASAMCGIFGLRVPVLWLVSSYVAILFLLRAPARTAATGPLAPLVGAVARAARSGAVLVCFVNGCLQVCEICGRASSSVRARVRARPPLPFAVVSPCACCILCVCCALRLCCSSSLSPLTLPSSVSRAAPFASLVTAARPRLGLARGSSVARCVLCVCRASSLFLCLLLFASPSLLPSVAAGAPSPSLLPTVAAGAPARSSCVPLCGSSSRARLCSPATCGSLCWSLAGAGC